MVGFLNTYFELLQFMEIIYITNKCYQYVICLSFILFVRLFMRNIQTHSCISTPIENLTHVYMNLFTRNSPYCQLLKQPVYITHLYGEEIHLDIRYKESLRKRKSSLLSSVAFLLRYRD
jgi:hypothetical protein